MGENLCKHVSMISSAFANYSFFYPQANQRNEKKPKQWICEL